jgi:Di-haem oxidoreductase, putative peroxidase
VVPKTFATAGRQGEAAGGAILLYTRQSLAFQNRQHNAKARTADFTAASGPRYLSINNAFGRPWIANAPSGLHGDGSVTVVDPSGEPLDNAPSNTAGGVFAGRTTDRERTPKGQPSNWIAKALNYRASGQLTPGSLAHGALGTAFLGPSPDGSGLAVFAVVTSDGAVLQVHVQDGVDGLAGPGTVGGLSIEDDPGVIGIAFKWNPQRVLYLADAARDRLVLLHLDDDRRHFKVGRTSIIMSPALKQPVDVAAALPEIANPSFASHTTLAGGSDLYVANRGDGSLLRVSQDGHVLARARIEVPGLGALGRDRIRAIAVSADAQRVWLTLQGELPGFAGHDGALIEVSAFDASGPFSVPPDANTTAHIGLAQAGELAFQKEFTPESGLGPLLNARACVTCHPGPGGLSTREEHFVRRVAGMDTVSGRVTPIEHPNSPVARRYSTRELGLAEAPLAALPRQTNVVSLRMPLALYASARLDEIPDIEIAAQAVSKGDGIKGRVHFVTSANGELRAGRYGWKAHIATLEEMVADAFANEIGIASPLAPHSHIGPQTLDDDGSLVRAVAAYLRGLRVPKVAPP